jgi:hypothetical protein
MRRRRKLKAWPRTFSLFKPKGALARWLAGADGASRTTHKLSGKALPPRYSADVNQRLLSFLGRLTANPEEWLGRVRLVNLNTIRQRIGPAWPKLIGKIELLAAKIIREELSLRDSYVRIGEAEFILVFTDASPQEAKIRCLTIVETIHEKLFGQAQGVRRSPERMAECQVSHAEGMSEKIDMSARAPQALDEQPSLEALRGLFRAEAENLDPADLATTAQAVLDLIIKRAAESHDVTQLDPLVTRLKHLSRNLVTLKPAVDLMQKSPDRDQAAALSLNDVQNDTADLISVMDVEPTRSHDEVLEALAQLRVARTSRAGASKNHAPWPPQPAAKKAQPIALEHLPVYRLVARGERVYRGIYRVNILGSPLKAIGHPGDGLLEGKHADDRFWETAEQERSLLQLSIKCCGEDASGDFMLITPVHVGTLHRPNLQRRYSTILRAGQPRTKRRLIIEIVGYRESDNTIAMRRAIEELRTHSHAVFVTQLQGEVDNPRVAVEDCKRLGANVVGLDVSRCEESEAKIVGAIRQFGLIAQECGVPAYIGGIRTAVVLAKTVASNVSYISAPSLIPPGIRPENFGQTTLEGLIWAV